MGLRMPGFVGVAIVGLISAFTIRAESQSVKLVGGGELRILKVSAGTNHFYTEEKGLKGLAARMLPSEDLKRLGITRREMQRPHGSLALWLSEVDSSGRRVPPTLKSAGARL